VHNKRERRFLFRNKLGAKLQMHGGHHPMILTTSRQGGTYTDRVLNFFSLILYRNERRMFGAVVLHRHRKKRSMQCKGSCSCCSPLWMARSDRPRRGGGVGRCIRLGPLAGRRGTCACRWGGGGHGGIRRQGPRLQVPSREDPARRWRRLQLLLGAEAEPQLQLVVVLPLLLLLAAAGVLLHGSTSSAAGGGAALVVPGSATVGRGRALWPLGETPRERKRGREGGGEHRAESGVHDLSSPR